MTTDPAAQVTELLKDLIRIDSSNPDLVPGAAGESAIADFTARWLTDRGFACTRLEAIPGRPSILAVAAGTGGWSVPDAQWPSRHRLPCQLLR